MTVPATRAPASLRIARGVIITQAALTGLITASGLVLAGVARRDDLAGRRAGDPGVFDGLGVGIGLYVAAVFGAVTVLLLVPAAVVLLHVVRPECREWCRRLALA